MPVDIEITADEWESFTQDMESINEELYLLWVADMEREFV